MPIRKKPRSSNRVAQASTRSRVRPSSAEVLGGALAQLGQGGANSSMWSNLAASRRVRQASWYRYWRRPAASVPTACRWPEGIGQIQTSFQAGGMARARMRARASGSVTGRPSGSS